RVARCQVGRPEDGKRHPEDARGVEPERHRGHVVAARPPAEPAGKESVDEIADEDADGGARHHALEHDVPGEVEGADEDRREDDEVRDVVEHEREERVQVSGAEERSVGRHGSKVARMVCQPGSRLAYAWRALTARTPPSRYGSSKRGAAWSAAGGRSGRAATSAPSSRTIRSASRSRHPVSTRPLCPKGTSSRWTAMRGSSAATDVRPRK